MIDKQTELFLKRVARTMAAKNLGIEDAMQAVLNQDREILNRMMSNPALLNATVKSLAAEIHTQVNAA